MLDGGRANMAAGGAPPRNSSSVTNYTLAGMRHDKFRAFHHQNGTPFIAVPGNVIRREGYIHTSREMEPRDRSRHVVKLSAQNPYCINSVKQFAQRREFGEQSAASGRHPCLTALHIPPSRARTHSYLYALLSRAPCKTLPYFSVTKLARFLTYAPCKCTSIRTPVHYTDESSELFLTNIASCTWFAHGLYDGTNKL
ncbi:hypothetical protein CBL_11814 [Carabus blaptoides fortunei]